MSARSGTFANGPDRLIALSESFVGLVGDNGRGVFDIDGYNYNEIPKGILDEIIALNSSGIITFMDNVIPLEIVLDSYRNIYITGYISTASISTNIYNYSTISSGVVSTIKFGTLVGSGNTDAVIVKYNSFGQAQWATNIGGTGADIGFGIAIDSENNVYTTGYFTTSTIVNSFAGLSTNSTVSTSTYGKLVGTGGQDAYIIKYNSSGQAQWATSICDSGGNDTGYGIVTDSDNNVYVTGIYYGLNATSATVNSYNNNLGVTNGIINTTLYGYLASPVAYYDAFIVKYNSSGQAQWATTIGAYTTDNNEYAYKPIVDSQNNIYVTGYSNSATVKINSFNSVSASSTISTSLYGTMAASGVYNAFIVKYNSSGQAQWATTTTGSSGPKQSYDMALDNNNNIYITGIHSGATSAVINSYLSNSGGVINLQSFGSILRIGSSDAFIIKYNSSGQAQWYTSVAGLGTEYGNGITTDSENNVYISGYFNTSTVVNSAAGVSGGTINLTNYGTLIASGGIDAFIVKYNSSGQAQWATNIGGISTDAGYGIATDSQNNIYTTGYFTTSTQINVFSTVLPIYSTTIGSTSTYGKLVGSGLLDSFIVKYNSSGMVQWATNIVGTGNDEGYSIVTDSANNLYATGYITSSANINSFVSVLANSTISTTLYGKLVGAGLADAYIVKYNPSGQVQWATTITGTSTDSGQGLNIDSENNVYAIGYLGGYSASAVVNNFVSTIANSTISTTLYGKFSPIGATDAYIVKYNSSGQAQWATNFGGTNFDHCYSVAIDSANNVYATGYFTTSTTNTIFNSFVSVLANSTISTTLYGKLVGSGDRDAYIVKYNSSGQAQWATNIGGTSAEYGYGIETDSANNVYAIGNFTTSTNVNNFVSTIANSTISTTLYGKLVGAGAADAYIVKYNSSGQAQWATNIGGAGADSNYSVAIDSANNVYVTGNFTTSTNVNNFESVLSNSTISTSIYGRLVGAATGISGSYIIKYNSSGQAQWATSVSGTGGDYGIAVTTDSERNVYVTGSFTISTNVNSFENISSTYISTSLYCKLVTGAGGTDAYIVKYNSSGKVQWVTTSGGTSTDSGRGITIDSQNNIYNTGNFTGSTNVNSASGIYDVYQSTIVTSTIATLAGTQAQPNAFVIKYTSSGKYIL